MRQKKEEIKKSILRIILQKPKNITQISRDINKQRASVSRLIKEMRGLVDIEEARNRGKERVIRIKKKGYSFLGIELPKSSSIKQVDEKKIRHSYLNSEELEILDTKEKEQW